MLKLVFFFVCAVGLQAGVVQGVVLEHLSGRPLARTVVRLDPIPQANAARLQPLTTRAARSGHFVFPTVAAGVYLLTATRAGYFPASFGQRLAIGRGKPITVTPDSDLFAELRLRHQGALTGRVLDENGVGTPGVPVVAYPASLPLRSTASAISDDRGVFRIHGLEPGKYWVRSAPHTLDDGSGWLPTFSPLAREIRDARVYRVTVDADSTDADVSPEPGGLIHIGGIITCDADSPVNVTVSSETGRRRTQTVCKAGYSISGLSPGAYEVFATLPDGSAAGFIEIQVEQSTDAANVQVIQIPATDIEVRRAGSSAAVNIPVTLIGRRQDLSETEPPREITASRAILAPGHWEFRARAPEGYYVESISNIFGYRRGTRQQRLPDSFDVFIEYRAAARIRVVVSDQGASIEGTVVSGGQPVPGAPIFLWPVGDNARRSLGGSPQTLSDTEGRYRLSGLPPGEYRLAASFDIYELDEDLLQATQAISVTAQASQATKSDLTLWVAP